jgi:hypothetical protein
MTDQKNKQPSSNDSSRAQNDPSKMQHNNPHDPKMGKRDDARNKQSNVENPDQDDRPDKEKKIDDDPGQTKKKIPNMNK